jgi:hypothetical protein
MSDPTTHEEAQLRARLTVLERVVGLMVRQSMLKTGRGPEDILALSEAVKKYIQDRTPEGPTDEELNDAADRFFSAIASDIGSQDSQ